jgi:integrase
MATIEERIQADGTTSFRDNIRLKGYPMETATFDRSTDATKWIKKTEADIKANRHFGESKRHTLNELIDEYVNTPQHKRLKSAEDMRQRLGWWRKHYGEKLLQDFTTAVIARARDKLLQENLTFPKRGEDGKVRRVEIDKKRSSATVNRYLAALSSICKLGVNELGWLDRNPVERVTKLKESTGRDRYLDESELPRFLAACRQHPDLYLAVLLSLTTGGRQAEIMGLRWSQIDLNQRRATLYTGTTKNTDSRVMSLVGDAYTLLVERHKVRDEKEDRIFPPTHAAEKSSFINLRTPFMTALNEAHITNFKWHDLRHTCASYLMMNGVSALEISKVLGHRTMAMVARYAHLAPTRGADITSALAEKLGVAG